jgi:hypothetical protein
MTEETNIEVAIEETLPIVEETVKATKTVKVAKYDIEQLELHLCCPNQFHHILNILPTLTKSEIKSLRDDLRTRINGMMHFTLEHKFRVALGEE